MPDYITTSVFDIFKIGPGPSSSHTIGPMKAALNFHRSIHSFDLSQDFSGLSIEVYLYGSLSLTGKGHGTHKAVLGGLMGWEPDTCDCDQLLALLEEAGKIYELSFAEKVINFTSENIHYEGANDSLAYQNTIRFTLSSNEKILLEKEYYSVGGGFIKCKGELEPKLPEPPHKYNNMRSFRKILLRSGATLRDVMIENEMVLTGKSKEAIIGALDELIKCMCNAVENGLQEDGLLPGPIGLLRKAKVLFLNSRKLEHETGRFLAELNAYAMAASEENAAGKKVVTAPTSGAAGVLPGVIYLLKEHFEPDSEQLRDGMLAAGLIAFIAKHNASIAGAEVGCQGEVGVASSMAAAFITSAHGSSMKRIENAAEIALEHQLGMTCDPVGGYVQIPCIERNAVGAVTAINAYILAQAGDPARQKVTFDEVIEAMMEIGRDMSHKYKETARGGLALSCVEC